MENTEEDDCIEMLLVLLCFAGKDLGISLIVPFSAVFMLIRE